MKKVVFVLGMVLFLGVAVQARAAMDVTTTNDVTTLIQTILGSGISVSNATYTGAAVASGTFANGLSSGIGIDTGIIMTSGAASLAVGPNSNDAITQDNGLGGDSDLNSLIPGYTTYDATVLEFDFQSDGGSLYFNYVFASDEYNEWVNSSYNDVFGFFLDGQNIALIPGTSVPVSINNVNGGSYSSYYKNNDPSNLGIPTPYGIEYDGFTTVLTAQALGLEAGESYHIKLAIADAGDRVLDSAVFIQGGTFSDEPTPVGPTVPEPATMVLFGSGLLGLGTLRKKKRG